MATTQPACVLPHPVNPVASAASDASPWNYPANLPVTQARAEILRALQDHQCLILQGATGSGKSTQLPKLCLEAGLGRRGRIAHTQPRRLAARTLAERVASELGQPCGDTIGWQVRFKAAVSEQTRVVLMTDGLLLSQMRRDRDLRAYDTIIVDEAHERSLNIDFLLGALRQILRRRPDLRLIITSATLEADKFSAHFNAAPVIDVPGKLHPIEKRYRVDPEADDTRQICDAVVALWREQPGDALVFLPGEREIRETAQALSRDPRLNAWPGHRVLPLYARLGSARQGEVFKPGGALRIVLATNVAETSVTVPGIRYVIDTGLARVSRYSPRSKMQHLEVEPIAQANAEQRAGRCGRTGPGVCLRLYAEADLQQRPSHTEPEVQRTNLAAVVLQMASLGLGRPEDFPFIDRPQNRLISDARRLLGQLGAMDAEDRITEIGRQLANLPVDPRLGRILLAGDELGCLAQMTVLVAFLSIQDPRERSQENRAKADQAHGVWKDRQSDFLGILNLWRAAEAEREALSRSAFDRWCKQNFLHPRRMQEWRDLRKQLRQDLSRLGFAPGDASAEVDPSRFHQALLYGFLDHIGMHETDGEFLGPRGARWRIHPESALRRAKPAWVVAAEIVRTSRQFGRIVAKIQPQWLEAPAGELLRLRAGETWWDARRGQAMTKEHASLFGLPVITGRPVPLARHDPGQARQLLIREGLVNGHWHGPRPAFLDANLQLQKVLREEEIRQRRSATLARDEWIAQWYDDRIPATVRNRKALQRWLKKAADDQLRLREAELRQDHAPDLDDQFPPELQLGEARYRLQYRFDPGAEDDGVTLCVPLHQLGQLHPTPLGWLVPGLLPAKIEALVRGLPKAQRRDFVPLPDTVHACQNALQEASGDVYAALSDALRQRSRRAPSPVELRRLPIPDNLRMRIAVLNENGKRIDSDRDLAALQARHGGKARDSFRRRAGDELRQTGLSDWTCPPLPDAIDVGGAQGFPCLCDQGGHVDVDVVDDPRLARRQHPAGLLRLMLLARSAPIKALLKSLPDQRQCELRLAARKPVDAAMTAMLAFESTVPLAPQTPTLDCAARAMHETCLDPAIRDRKAFENALESNWAPCQQRVRALWHGVQAVVAELSGWQGARIPASDAGQDLQAQIDALLAPGWILRAPQPADLARYLKGALLRLEKLRREPAADAQRLAIIAPYQVQYRSWCQACLAAGEPAPEVLLSFRWMLEEFRLSVFAQTVKTRGKISAKRMDKQADAVRDKLRWLGLSV